MIVGYCKIYCMLLYKLLWKEFFLLLFYFFIVFFNFVYIILQ